MVLLLLLKHDIDFPDLVFPEWLFCAVCKKTVIFGVMGNFRPQRKLQHVACKVHHFYLASVLLPFSFLSLTSSCVPAAVVFCPLSCRRCSWSPSVRSESGIWSLSPPSATKKRASCWAWISPTQTGVCYQDAGVLCHKEHKMRFPSGPGYLWPLEPLSLSDVCFLPASAVNSAPSVWFCQCGATLRCIWTEMGKKNVQSAEWGSNC